MASRYCLLWIPRSGLFYDGGGFFDGEMRRVPWRGVLPVFETHARAVTAKKKLKKKWSEAQGAFVVLKVSLKSKEPIGEEEWAETDGEEVLEMQEYSEEDVDEIS